MSRPSFLQILGAALAPRAKSGAPIPQDTSRGWLPLIREPFTGAWQRGEEIRVDTALSNSALFRCVSLIAGDIAKMCCRLVQLTADGIWEETDSPAFSPVLRKPNGYQNRIQFFTSWVQSKLTFGNTYVLKARDARGVVTALYILDPTRVRPMVSPDGSVFYQLATDYLAGLGGAAPMVPASDIIHDRWNTFYHPLVGLSPIYACGLAALQGTEIQRNSAKFFRNGARPGGILVAPGDLDNETAKRLKDHWETNYSGDNAGRIAVVGDGLKYEGLSFNAVDSQTIEQLKLSAEIVCGTLGVPPYMAGVGTLPANTNVEAVNQQYYSQCLQIHVESIELCLDEGLGLGADKKMANGAVYGTEFDLDGLLRMDTATQITTLKEAVTGGLYKPDEARQKLGKGKVKGGNKVYLQQQNFSLEALAKRDAKDDPFATAPKATPAAAPVADAANQNDAQAQAAKALLALHKGLVHVRR